MSKWLFVFFIVCASFSVSANAQSKEWVCDPKESASIRVNVNVYKEDVQQSLDYVDQKIAETKAIADKLGITDLVVTEARYQVKNRDIHYRIADPATWHVEGNFEVKLSDVSAAKKLMVEMVKQKLSSSSISIDSAGNCSKKAKVK